MTVANNNAGVSANEAEGLVIRTGDDMASVATHDVQLGFREGRRGQRRFHGERWRLRTAELSLHSGVELMLSDSPSPSTPFPPKSDFQ
ncbi:hypothetical protein Nepgr_029326 [Nepenthes gracilis]|uniref:Uncharacterized protein n=1 Tax=Nepenthes gracilis TaxID=150966 RepID=A0AAD3TCA0_NEPGR|nr:hypothetical protein Nepgr_029326 [Nepenthes gracilis]